MVAKSRVKRNFLVVRASGIVSMRRFVSGKIMRSKAYWMIALSGFVAATVMAADEAAPLHPEPPKSAKVVIATDPAATEAFVPRAEKIPAMVERGLKQLTGKVTVKEAWLSLVKPEDRIGIKVHSAPGRISGTRPAVVEAVVKELIDAGIPAKQIIVWDRSIVDLRLAGFFDLVERYGIRVEGAAQNEWDDKVSYENAVLGNLIWGDLEFGRKGEGVGRKSYVSKLVTQEMTKIISIAPLLNHNFAGVCGNIYSLALGSVDNNIRFEGDAGRMAMAVPELYALPELGDRVVLNITDALICQYQGTQQSLLHYSRVLNQLRFSTDPLALDVLSLKELADQRKAAKVLEVKANEELYRNAELLEIGVNDLKHIQVIEAP